MPAIHGQGTLAGYTLAYDAADRLTQQTSTTDGTVNYSYDATGQLTSASPLPSDGRGAGGEGTLPTESYSYDANGNRTITGYQTGANNELLSDGTYTYTYDAEGNRTIRTRISNDPADDYRTEYTWDYRNRLTAVTFKNNAGTVTKTVSYTLAGYTLAYDAADELTQQTSTADGTVNYTYDATGQLTSVSPLPSNGRGAGGEGGLPAESYSYDANGNRTTTGYQTGANNQLLSDGTYTYTYDAEGNRTSRTSIADGSTMLYAWDYRNRLTAVTFKNSSGVVTQTVSYTYDAFDRMVSRTLSIPGQADQKTVFVYDGNNVLEQFDGTGSGTLTAANLSHRYLWGAAVDQLLADEQVTSTQQAGQVLWTLGDYENTIRDIATYNAGVTSVVNHRMFDAFGNMTGQTNAAVDCVMRWTGRYFDRDTGLQLNGKRWYDPKTATWLSRDPIEADVNSYRYCGNGPTDGIDPDGLCRRGRIPRASSTVGSVFQGGGMSLARMGQGIFGVLGHLGLNYVPGYQDWYDYRARLISDWADDNIGPPGQPGAYWDGLPRDVWDDSLGAVGALSVFSGGEEEGPTEAPGESTPEVPGASRPGLISGNPANQLLDTGTPLKDGSGWAQRWYRITPEDAQAYRNACADKLDQLYQESKCMPEADRTPYHFQEMSKFRNQWLKEFLENRDY